MRWIVKRGSAECTAREDVLDKEKGERPCVPYVARYQANLWNLILKNSTSNFHKPIFNSGTISRRVSNVATTRDFSLHLSIANANVIIKQPPFFARLNRRRRETE